MQMQNLEILFEDEALVAVNKPPGIPSQGTRDPKRTHVLECAEKQLGCKLFLHHRLDRDTSGVLVFGKDPSANARLTDIFREHEAQKSYLALSKINSGVKPEIQKTKNFTVKLHMAPVRGAKGVERMVVVKSGGWVSETDFETLWSDSTSRLFLAHPKTGRTHQLRVHLAHNRLPILGDSLYGGKSSSVPRLMLHAWKLKIPHPTQGGILELIAPIPKDMASVFQRLQVPQSVSDTFS